jgi:phosphoribosylformylglycinamidine synthase
VRNWLTLLFGETPSRIILTVRPENVREVTAIAEEEGAQCALIGEVTTDRLKIELAGDLLVDEAISDLEAAFRNTLPLVLDTMRRNVAPSEE